MGNAPQKSPMVGRNLVLIYLYPWPKHGARGPNEDTMRSLLGCVRSLSGPWAIMADWNHGPEELLKT
eukprot:1501521-Pyramimonas_sp.AAC.1